MKKQDKVLRIIEFFVVGILIGLTEDLLAIKFATDAKITFHVVLIVLLVAIPFAMLSELLVDHPRFWEFFSLKKKNNYKEEN